MKDAELKKIWENVNGEFKSKSVKELDLLLTSKINRTVNKFLIHLGLSIFISISVLVYLAITSFNRQGDLFYLINNGILGIVVLFSVIFAFLYRHKLQKNKLNLPLKKWLALRIEILNKNLHSKYEKLYILVIPLLYCLTLLSIHVYFEDKLFVEVLKTEESISGLFVGGLLGLFLSFYVFFKIRKYQIQNLKFLHKLYKNFK